MNSYNPINNFFFLSQTDYLKVKDGISSLGFLYMHSTWAQERSNYIIKERQKNLEHVTLLVVQWPRIEVEQVQNPNK
jgi:hypothetical protein